MARSRAGIEVFAVGGKDVALGSAPFFNVGMRENGTLEINDDVRNDWRDKPDPIAKIFTATAKSYQVRYEDLKVFIQNFCVDGDVKTQLVTTPQALDGANKVKDVYNFGYTPNGQGYMDFGFKFELGKERSADITTKVRLPYQLADTLIRTAKTNTTALTEGVDTAKRYRPYLFTIESPSGTNLVDQINVKNRMITLESEGEDSELSGKTSVNFIKHNIELTIDAASVDAFISLLEKDSQSTLKLYEWVTPTVRECYFFNGSVGRQDQFMTDKTKRELKITFAGKSSLLDIDFAEATAGGITTKTITFN